MARPSDQINLVYTTYIHGTPEQVWRGLTDPAFTSGWWRHHKAGGKKFTSDWKTGSTYAMIHDEIGLVVSDPAQVIAKSEPYRGSPSRGTRSHPNGQEEWAWTRLRSPPGGPSPGRRSPSTSNPTRERRQANRRPRRLRTWQPRPGRHFRRVARRPGKPEDDARDRLTVALVGRGEPRGEAGMGPACTAILTGRRGCRRSQCPRSCKKRLQRQNSASSKKAAMYKNRARLTVRWTETAT